MAAKSAGVIRINLTAGTAEFIAAMDKSNAKLREFGATAQAAGGHGVTGVQAVSGALRVLEGGITNNLRAAERFTANVLGLGPLLQKAFPVIGAIAFLGIVGKLGEEVNKFLKNLRTIQDASGAAFRELTAPLRQTNDELQLSNDRLANEIAKLEGRRQNTLKIALDEAVVSADKLADSLQKDFEKLNQFLAKNENTVLQRLLGGSGITREIKEFIGGETGQGGATGRAEDAVANANQQIEQITAKARAQADSLKDVAKANAILAQANTEVVAVRAKAAAQANHELEIALQKVNEKLQSQKELREASTTGFYKNGEAFTGVTNPDLLNRDIESLQGAQRALQEMQRNIPLQLTNANLAARKSALEAERDAANIEKPLKAKLAELDAQIAAATLKLSATGLNEAQKVLAEAQGKAIEAVAEINKALSRRNPLAPGITKDEEAEVRQREITLAQTNAQEQYSSKLGQTSRQIQAQTRETEFLTAAIGKGYEAVKAAAVQSELLQKVGLEDFLDPKKKFANFILSLQIAADYEAKNTKAIKEANEATNQQVNLETRLAQVQALGARQVELEQLKVSTSRLRDLGYKQQAADEEQKFFAQLANRDAAELASINQRIANIQRLTAAYAQGEDAVKKAQLANQLSDLGRKGGTAVPGLSGSVTFEQLAAIKEQAAATNEEIAKAAGARVNTLSNQLALLAKEEAYLKANAATYKDTAAYAEALREIDDARLKILVQQQLQLRTAAAGVRAFFLEMQEQGKSAAQAIYDALNSALDKISDNFAKFLTRQKTDWAKAFKDIGQELLKSSIKSGLEKVIGDVGKKLGISGKPDGTAANPLHVLVDNLNGQGGTGSSAGGGTPSILQGNGGLLGTGQVPTATQQPGQRKTSGGIGGFFGNLLHGLLGIGGGGVSVSGGGGGGGIPDVSSSISFGGEAASEGAESGVDIAGSGIEAFASGGDYTPGSDILVGERGPELLRTSGAGRVLNNTDTRKVLAGSGDSHVYNIDARGTDPNLTAIHVEAAIRAAHNSAVGMSIRAGHQQSARTPQRTVA